MKIGFVGLGCARNLVDLEAMLGLLRQHQYEITLRPEKAEILLINTCGFIREAVEESTEAILEAAEWKRKGRIQKIVVSGCLPQRYQGELSKELPEVDAFLGSGEQARIVEVIDRLSKGVTFLPNHWPHPRFLVDGDTPRFSLTPPYTAYLKISEGCLNSCRFCIIPKIKGGYRERSLESILEEARRLSETRPLKELNLIGQDTSLYGLRHYGKKKLPKLLRGLSRFGKIPWIRVLYLHPAHFTDELIEVFQTEQNICSYIDIPIQHASDKILFSMKRECTQNQMRSIFGKLREALPELTLRSSVMVGYPGEDEKDFETLLQFIEEIQFDRLGAFIFSKEEGTEADRLPDHLPEELKGERYRKVMTLQREISKKRLERFVGKTVEVLLEEADAKDPTLWIGRRQGDAPEVDGQVFVRFPSGTNGQKKGVLRPGEIVSVLVQQSLDYDLVGEAV